MFDENQYFGRVVSLFAGCGGLDLGFTKAGFHVTNAFDNDAKAVACYNANHLGKAQQKLIDDSIKLNEQADIIVAGPPCQGFSTGGGYKNKDPRNALLLVTCRQIAKSRVRLAVIENVAALTNRRNAEYLERALAILQGAGYFCSMQVYSASDFGVAQRRKRAVIIARLGASSFRCPTPKRTAKPTVARAFNSMPETLQAHKPRPPETDSKHAIVARRIGPGQKLCNVRAGPASVATWDIPEWYGLTSSVEKEILQTVRRQRRRNRKRNFGDADPLSLEEIRAELPDVTNTQLNSLIDRGFMRSIEGNFDLKDTFNGKYRRLDSDDVSPTVDTRFGDIQLFLHPTENRSLTVREAARLQGFPDSFIFPEREKDAFRLIGNAVPPPMSIQIAEACKELLS